MWHKRSLWAGILVGGAISLVILWSLGPIYFMVVFAFREPGSRAIGLELPKTLNTEYFEYVMFSSDSLWRYLGNTVIASGATTLIVLSVALPAAYAFSRWDSRLSKAGYLSFFVLRMIPPVALIIPYYVIFLNLGLLDTLYVLILAYVPLGLPLAIWLMKGFFDTVPRSLEEAAQIDGATRSQTLTRIVLPIAVHGVVVTAAFVFLTCYIEYMYCVTLTESRASTFSMYVAAFIGDITIYTEEMLAAAIVGTIPLIALYAFLQKYIRKGVIFGALK